MEKGKRSGRPPSRFKESQSASAPEVMDIPSLAKYLGMGKSKIYALIRLRKIPASRIGRQYRFSKTVIDNWLKEKLITHAEEPQMPLTFALKHENPVKEESPKPQNPANQEEPRASN